MKNLPKTYEKNSPPEKKENNNEEKDESVFRNPIEFIWHAKYGNDGLPNYDEDKIKGKMETLMVIKKTIKGKLTL